MIFEIAIKWFVPFILGAGVSALVAYYKKKSALAEGVKCLLRGEIVKAHEKYSAKGYCPVAMKDVISKEYTAYHNLGGNDVATNLYHEIMQLPRDSKGIKGIDL